MKDHTKLVAELEKCGCNNGYTRESGGNPMSEGYQCPKCSLRRRAASAIREQQAENSELRAKLAKAEGWIEKCALKMEELAAGELSSNVFTISSLHRAAKEMRKFAVLKEGKSE